MKTLLQSYSGGDMNSMSPLSGLSGGMLAVVVVLYIAVIAVMLIAMWRIYTKCGQPGWACLIPIYNYYIFAKMVGKPKLFTYILLAMGGYILGAIITGIGAGAGIAALAVVGGIVIFASAVVLIIFGIQLIHGLSTAFGQTAGFTVGLILLGIIFYPMLAFGNYTYQLGAAASGDNTTLDA
jgi:hypothetical protein